MIKICFVAPYPELLGDIEELFLKHPLHDQLNYRTRVLTGLDDYRDLGDVDVVVARGFVAEQLRSSNIPLVHISVSAYDIIRSVDECIRRFSPRRIGCLWSESVLQDADEVCKLYTVPIQLYKADEENLRETIRQAVEDGCDALVGGYILQTLLGPESGVNYTITRTGRATLERSIDEAIRTVQVIHRERENAELCRVITQQAKDAIVYVGEDMCIGLINQQAVNLTDKPLEARTGTRLERVFPELGPKAIVTMSSGELLRNMLHRVGDVDVSVDYVPVMVNQAVRGVVITFQRVSDIQRTELKIRRQLGAKGLHARYRFADILHRSEVMAFTIETARRYARAASNILLVGETGTGKELMAQSIHNESSRRGGPFVAVNCASLPEHLLESEMFGYVEGAFTGAVKGGKAGLFELAHNGTLFLDEISELPINFQSKLLRALQEREIRRVGGDKVIQVNIRIIAATNKDLREMIRDGMFREDLYYRLDVLHVDIHPLRRRREDIGPLFSHYLAANCASLGRPSPSLSPEAEAVMADYDFPGNVRELCNLAERAAVICDGAVITERQMHQFVYGAQALRPAAAPSAPPPRRRLSAEEDKQLVEQALRDSGGHMGRAAEQLAIDRSTLWRKIKRYQIRTPS